MALSTILKITCPTCNKVAVERRSYEFAGDKVIELECGHVVYGKSLKSSLANVVSSDGRSLRPYQMQGVEFLEKSNARALLGDEQGLGKTVQIAALLKLHPDELFPCLIVTKTALKFQWMWEMFRWTDEKRVQVIQTGKEKALPGFMIYVVTYDLLKREDMFDFVGIKTIVLDECQAIKDHLSGRAKAVQKIVTKQKIEHIIGATGTAIKNHAGEYFTICNLLDPRLFPHYQRYLDDYCDYYWNGYGNKVGGLKNPEHFREVTKEIILRRTKEEVLPDLPKLERKFFHCELDPRLNKTYSEALKELDDILYADDMDEIQRASSILAVYTKMRWVTGISKTEPCVEWVTEFLMSNSRKLVIFAHHHDVVTKLEADLNTYLVDGGFEKCLNFHAGLSSLDRQKMIEKFRDGDNRIMIASTLAAGEGLNLQFCSDAIMLERQWNPANEEQAEARFHRFGQENPVSITYMIASKTIDEYFTELVEQKRAIVASALDGKEIVWDQNSLMKELAMLLVSRGQERWRMPV